MVALLLGLVRARFSRGLDGLVGLFGLGLGFVYLGFCCCFDLLGFEFIALVLELLVWWGLGFWGLSWYVLFGCWQANFWCGGDLGFVCWVVFPDFGFVVLFMFLVVCL